MDACRQCLLADRLGIPTLLPEAVLGRTVSVEDMEVGMVALEVPEVAEVMAAVADLWVPPRHLETGGVVSDPMHMEAEAAAVAAVVGSEVEETVTSGLNTLFVMNELRRAWFRTGRDLDTKLNITLFNMAPCLSEHNRSTACQRPNVLRGTWLRLKQCNELLDD